MTFSLVLTQANQTIFGNLKCSKTKSDIYIASAFQA